MGKKDRDGMSKREMFREKRRRTETRNRLIGIGLIVLGAALVAFFLIYPTLRPVDVVTVTPLTRSQVDFNNVGDPNAPKEVEGTDPGPSCGGGSPHQGREHRCSP